MAPEEDSRLRVSPAQQWLDHATDPSRGVPDVWKGSKQCCEICSRSEAAMIALVIPVSC